MIDPRLFLIYQAFKEKYDMVLENNILQIKNLSVILHTNENILKIYSDKDFHNKPYCLIKLDTLEVIPIQSLDKKEAMPYITLAYVLKEILKPNSIKFIESL